MDGGTKRGNQDFLKNGGTYLEGTYLQRTYLGEHWNKGDKIDIKDHYFGCFIWND